VRLILRPIASSHFAQVPENIGNFSCMISAIRGRRSAMIKVVNESLIFAFDGLHFRPSLCRPCNGGFAHQVFGGPGRFGIRCVRIDSISMTSLKNAKKFCKCRRGETPRLSCYLVAAKGRDRLSIWIQHCNRTKTAHALCVLLDRLRCIGDKQTLPIHLKTMALAKPKFFYQPPDFFFSSQRQQTM
jgi:hypothetical protein